MRLDWQYHNNIIGHSPADAAGNVAQPPLWAACAFAWAGNALMLRSTVDARQQTSALL